MNDLLCPTNPKYNGHHMCPRCGQPSFWTCSCPNEPRIQVECLSGCGTYERPHADLAALPYFEHPDL